MAFGKGIVLVAIVQKRVAPDSVRQAIGYINRIDKTRANEPNKQTEIFQGTDHECSPLGEAIFGVVRVILGSAGSLPPSSGFDAIKLQ